MVSKEFRQQIEGYGLTTAHILYRIPDHPGVLQTYVWQDYDLAPRFPVLTGFLDFWKRELEGPLHSVRVAHSQLIKPAEFRAVNGVLTLH
ncbi:MULTISPECIES: usg protein [Methylobacterium]|uniref:Aspartate-semialdehyde dehydrogenase n=2 Tax=Methylobacterium TaxID=407 RepID=A0A2U8WP07_9HYPH|nr:MULTISPECIES: usg protein [Methylobacterium]AWB21144.1 aspartate-semialdehyde dehydrogenase [Methylobacterium currus]AWN46942.1 aspartate-semialdehyde dehydrogenase [Methylobacterium terrae]AWN52039.1 aspartate-semialdehyde dehydrogenase [Methylobacterium sp. 17Sr1-1]UHC14017.1 usg protein [Methylobacterium currus]SFV07983.1 Usg protein (tryptophan operon, function unknown) [Methylobacterium sp. 174MFSha1.1]